MVLNLMVTYNTDMKRLTGYWKIFAALFLVIIAMSAAIHYASADGIKVNIAGSILSDGNWQVGSNSVVWSASADNGGTIETLTANTTITWSTSDSSVVRITPQSSGNNTVSQVVLSPVSAGTATVTATFNKLLDNGDGTYTTITEKAERKVVVKLAITNPPVVPYEDTNVASDIYTTASGSVTFTSSNEDVAKVTPDASGSGKVSLEGAGSTVITAHLSDGQTDTCRIVVNARITETVFPLEIEYMKTHTLLTNAVDNSYIYFESANEDVADIDNKGVITGNHAGNTTIYVRALDSTDAWYSLLPSPARNIVVKVPFTITSEPTMNVGDSALLETNVDSKYANQVSWNTSNSEIVEITQDGKISAKKSGTAVISATISNKSLFGTSDAQVASIVVTVIDKFSLSSVSQTVQAGSSFELEANVTDSNATVDWTSSNEAVAKITTSTAEPYKIIVTGVKKGTAVITAVQTVNGVSKSATCQVEVTEPVQNITLTESEASVDKGSTHQLTAVFTPQLPDNRTIKWVSSDETVARVSDTGLVTGVGGGTASISVVTEDGIKVASCNIYVRVPVTGISLSETSIAESLNLQTHQLTATVTPSGAGVDTSVEWTVSPSNGSVIKVDQNGLVTYVAPGNATVIAKSVDGGYLATCQVEVLKPVTSISIDYDNVTLGVGEQFRLSAEALPTDATDRSVIWESSDASVATVDSNGMVTAVKSGSATILVKTVDGGLTAMCNIKVYQPVTSLTISDTKLSIRKGNSAWLGVTVIPSNADNKNVTWSSTDDTVATVDVTGKVTGIEAGTCTIVATSNDSGVTAKCTLTVTQSITGIKLNASRKTIMKDDQFALIPTIKPSDAENKNVTYSSSEPEVATVDVNGIVTGLQGGQTVIMVTTEDRGLTASCLVTVQQFVSSVKISGGKSYIQKGQNISLKAKTHPATATNRKVVWKSSNAKVLYVNAKGVVKAKGYGTATIYAYAADGSGKYAKYTMTVIKPLKHIVMNRKEMTIKKRASKRIKVSLRPKDATYKGVKWSSSSKKIAKVNKNGVVTGISSGTAIITCRSTKYSEVVATCVVHVKEYVESIKISGQGKRGEISYGYTKHLKATVKPKTATNKKLRWWSSNPGVLSVDQSGNVTAVGYGSAIIYAGATDNSGVVDSVGFTVIKPVGNITVSPSSLTLLEGKNAKATATVNPADATYTAIKWKTSDKAVATVDYSGEITAITAGTCKVYAVSTDGNGIQGVINVKVNPMIHATSIAVNSSNITMLPGQSRKLTSRMKPSNATENISWVSSDTSVVTVDASGNVTARGQGIATVTAVTSESGMESSCEVIVLALNATYITLEQYDSYDLDVFGATDKITWYSNNKRVATVDSNGKVVARMAGTTRITAKVNGKVLYCTVVVKKM